VWLGLWLTKDLCDVTWHLEVDCERFGRAFSNVEQLVRKEVVVTSL
jgi:hypothetical protein